MPRFNRGDFLPRGVQSITDRRWTAKALRQRRMWTEWVVALTEHYNTQQKILREVEIRGLRFSDRNRQAMREVSQ